MGSHPDTPAELERNIAANVRRLRETRELSQGELAQRMADRGHGFSQATIWKIEQGKRPVKMSEAIALAEELQLPRGLSLADDPGMFERETTLRLWHFEASRRFDALKKAAAEYLHAQVEVAIAAAEVHGAGDAVHEAWVSWLDIPAETAVIEARIADEQDHAMQTKMNDEVDKVVRSLEEHGYPVKIDYTEIYSEGPKTTN